MILEKVTEASNFIPNIDGYEWKIQRVSRCSDKTFKLVIEYVKKESMKE